MKNTLSFKNLARLVLIWVLLFSTPSAGAQAGRQILLSPPDPARFPRMALYFDATERDGQKITDLTADQISLRENSVSRELLDFQALTPGIQLAFAINISPPFAIQDIRGRSRFDYIREGLLNWAAQPQAGSMDDISLVSADGLELAHLDDKEQFSQALIDYQPNLRESQADLTVLARAIEIASDPVDQLGMKKVVLFFSSQPPAESTAALESMLAQAKQNQVRIYTILVSSPAFFTSAGASRLQILSTETGGELLPFSGDEALVDFGQLLAPLRSTFYIEYDSLIVTPGTHTLELTLSTPRGDSQGSLEFMLDVQPPNPIFVSPPREITRQLPESSGQAAADLDYQPAAVPINVLVEFPDNHPRDLEELIFRVDGEIVERRTEPPFDQFIWDLSAYQTSGTYRLTLEAVDEMGLSRTSVQTPIDIIVETPPPDIGTILADNALALGGLGGIIFIGLMLFFLIARGRIQPADPLDRRSARQARENKALLVKTGPKGKGTTPERQALPYRLIPINDISQQLFPEPIRVEETEIHLGRDSRANQIQIDHHSVAGDHACISLGPENRYRISDQGTPVGTWINYQQITGSKSHVLKDGDIINIGEAGFRFQILSPVTPESKLQEKTK